MKILLLDIEISPTLLFAWGLHQEVHSTDFMQKDWYILCFAAKWLDEKKIHSSALVDFADAYKKNPEDDSCVLKELWPLLDQADIVVTHNGIQFDRRKIQARFIINGMKPPSPYRMVDTLDIARKEFGFTSNKLGDISKFLGVGEKVATGGFQLWKDCLAGLQAAWKRMVTYCRGDILLLERVYLALRPYVALHPHVNPESDEVCCPKCGSDDIQYRGYKYTNLSKFRQFVCNECGGWGRLRVNELPKKVLTANA